MDTGAFRRMLAATLAIFAIGAMAIVSPTVATAEPASEEPLYYLENPYSGESMFTVDRIERDTMRANGWTYVSTPLVLPSESGSPVYRLFNPNASDHLFTQDLNEYNTLGEMGWTREGVKFYSDDAQSAPMFRLYAAWITGPGSHIYTTSADYNRQLAQEGWGEDGPRWFGLRTTVANDRERYQGLYYPDLDYSVPSQSNEGTPGTSAAPAPTDEGRRDVLAYARQYLGYPYRSGEETPAKGFDCSGLTQWVCHLCGVELPRTTWEQMEWLKGHGTWTSDLSQLKPGDLIFIEYGNHVAIFAGTDPVTGSYMMIDAPGPGKTVSERVLYAVYPGAYSGYSFLGGGSVL